MQEATSGNRDMYQEVDLIDIALGSARKQCDDAKERANRLSVTVDRLRDALSRFMSKARVPQRTMYISSTLDTTSLNITPGWHGLG